jgi:hypothetical protein
MKRLLVAALAFATCLALFLAGCLPYRPLDRYPDSQLKALRDKINAEPSCGQRPAATIDWAQSRVVLHVLWIGEPLTAGERRMVENPGVLMHYPCDTG